MEAVDLPQLNSSVALNDQLVADLLQRAVAVETKLNKARTTRNGFDALNQQAGRRDVAALVGEAKTNGDGDGAGAAKPLPLGLSGAWYADMLDDNTQLKTTLSKFQSAIDLIMVKHRSQTTQLVKRVNTLQDDADTRVDAAAKRGKDAEAELAKVKGKMEEMLQVISLAVTIDNDKAGQSVQELERLKVENQGLRELLGIAGIPNPGFEDEDCHPFS